MIAKNNYCIALSHIFYVKIDPFELACARKDKCYKTYSLSSSRFWSSQESYGLRISNLAKDFITKILQVEPERRMTLEDMANHPWLASETLLSREEVIQEMQAKSEMVAVKP